MTLKTLKDFADEPCQDVAPDNCEGRKRLKEELREAANDWRYYWKNTCDNIPVLRVDESLICWIEHFFNLEAEE